MPLKRSFDGAYVRQKLQSGAQQLLADQAELRQRELSGQAAREEPASDSITVVQRPAAPLASDPLREPRVEWETTGTVPFDLPPMAVSASQSEALRNKQSLGQLLERRLRMQFRLRLLASRRLPEGEARARVMRLKVHVADVSLLIRPGEG
jgi:hypothetical protein